MATAGSGGVPDVAPRAGPTGTPRVTNHALRIDSNMGPGPGSVLPGPGRRPITSMGGRSIMATKGKGDTVEIQPPARPAKAASPPPEGGKGGAKKAEK